MQTSSRPRELSDRTSRSIGTGMSFPVSMGSGFDSASSRYASVPPRNTHTSRQENAIRSVRAMLSVDVTRWWVVTTDQRGYGPEERKEAFPGRNAPTGSRRSDRLLPRRERRKPLSYVLTKRPAALLRRAVIGQRAFRWDTPTGGAGSNPGPVTFWRGLLRA